MKLPGKSNFGVLALCAVLLAAGGAGSSAQARERKAPPQDVTGPAGDYPVVVGDPFLVGGVTYTPSDTMNYDAVGKAVLAAAADASRISGAHRTLPVPSYVEVTSLDSGRTILVRLDQRGPMSGDGLVALSPMAWAQLGLPVGGSAAANVDANTNVRVRRVNPPEQERALLRTGQTAPLRMDTPAGLLAALRRKLGVEPPVGELPMTIKPAAVAVLPPKLLVAPKPPPARKPVLPPKQAPAPKPAPVAMVRTDDSPMPVSSPVSPVTSAQRIYVQIGAFAQRANADAAARKSGGALVRVGGVWRVRSGPFATGTAADSALAKARRAGYASARTVRD